ncbi:MAG: hypothetical protein WC699_05835 [Bacteroidales bacterium]|jgi:hypothetical protein
MLKKDFAHKHKFIRNEGFTFEIRGILGNAMLSLPLSDEYLIETCKLDLEFNGFDKELAECKSWLQALWREQNITLIKIVKSYNFQYPGRGVRNQAL